MPNDGIPFYISMDSVKVLDAGNTEVSHGIVDVWVEANNDNIGAFGLPCNIPVLQQNDVRFVVSAGIKESGQSGVRVIYPFYNTDTFSITAIPGTQYSHKPVFKYVSAAQFTITENFDNTNEFGPSGNFTIISTPDPNVDSVYGGTRCIKLSVTATDSSKKISSNKYDLPEGQEIWLEVDYKSEVPFFIGFNGYFGSNLSPYPAPVLFVTAQPNWNKVYVKFSNYVGAMRADTYSVYFEALRPYGSTGGSVYLDNVKLVHF